MHTLAKMTEMVLNCQNRQTVNKIQMRWERGPSESGDFGKNARNGDLSPNTPNCKQKFKHDGKGALWKVAILAKMAYLAKMAEMSINRRNRQIINKNANEMPKGPFGK